MSWLPNLIRVPQMLLPSSVEQCKLTEKFDWLEVELLAMNQRLSHEAYNTVANNYVMHNDQAVRWFYYIAKRAINNTTKPKYGKRYIRWNARLNRHWLLLHHLRRRATATAAVQRWVLNTCVWDVSFISPVYLLCHAMTYNRWLAQCLHCFPSQTNQTFFHWFISPQQQQQQRKTWILFGMQWMNEHYLCLLWH